MGKNMVEVLTDEQEKVKVNDQKALEKLNDREDHDL